MINYGIEAENLAPVAEVNEQQDEAELSHESEELPRNVFVKEGLLIVYVDRQTEKVEAFTKLVAELDFEGEVQVFRTPQEALDFLRIVVNTAGERVAPDLIFCSYC